MVAACVRGEVGTPKVLGLARPERGPSRSGWGRTPSPRGVNWASFCVRRQSRSWGDQGPSGPMDASVHYQRGRQDSDIAIESTQSRTPVTDRPVAVSGHDAVTGRSDDRGPDPEGGIEADQVERRTSGRSTQRGNHALNEGWPDHAVAWPAPEAGLTRCWPTVPRSARTRPGIGCTTSSKTPFT